MTGITYYFIDKCLSFRHSISCALFQDFSDALAHITKYLFKIKLRAEKSVLMNYLDDFLFASLLQELTDKMMDIFLDMCETVGVPVSKEKTERACNAIIFLGILLDGYLHVLVVPQQKKDRALQLLHQMMDKRSATVRELQGLAGLLNFLYRAIVPGRAFTRRMYAKFSHVLDKNGNRIQGSKLKPCHHIKLDAEFKADCIIWASFLELQDINRTILCRPFVDIHKTIQADTLQFFTDAAKGKTLGMGGVLHSLSFFAQWEPNYIKLYNPSIEYLELLAICMETFCWSEQLQNQCIIMFCDNESMVTMVNDTMSSCKNCMLLIRKLVLRSLEYNFRIFCRWIKGSSNFKADFLSRMKLEKFRSYVKQHGINTDPDPMPLNMDLWPASKLWLLH